MIEDKRGIQFPRSNYSHQPALTASAAGARMPSLSRCFGRASSIRSSPLPFVLADSTRPSVRKSFPFPNEAEGC